MAMSYDEYKQCKKNRGIIGKILNEDKANEMFRKLGYIKETKYINKTIVECMYRKNDDCIWFYKNRTFGILKSGSYTKNTGITMQELQAIYQNCQEMGWLE